MLQLFGLDDDGRIALQVWFDIEDNDAAIAELDALHARFEGERPRRPLENAASRVSDRLNELFAGRRFDEIAALFSDVNLWVQDRRRGLRRESNDRATEVANIRAVADLGIVRISVTPLAVRGDRLCLAHVTLHGRDAFGAESLAVTEVERRVDRDHDRIRLRRLRRRYRRARRPIPLRRGSLARTHMVTHRWGIRSDQPTRIPGDDLGLGDHGPSANSGRSRRCLTAIICRPHGRSRWKFESTSRS